MQDDSPLGLPLPQTDSRSPEGKTHHGFTLIELLVVIAIIAILAAILFPVFAQAREKARQTSCIANLKNIAMSHLMYSQDNDETLPSWVMRACPPSPIYRPQNTSLLLWTTYLQPYLKNGQVVFCPSAAMGEGARQQFNVPGANWLADYSLRTTGPRGLGTQASPYERDPGTVVARTVYNNPSGNPAISGCTSDNTPTCGQPIGCVDRMSLSRLLHPGETINYSDGFCVLQVSTTMSQRHFFARHHKVQWPPGSTNFTEDHPSGGVVCGFSDGHAKLLKRVDVDSVVFRDGLWVRRYRSADK